jgi:hypothetical protein
MAQTGRIVSPIPHSLLASAVIEAALWLAGPDGRGGAWARPQGWSTPLQPHSCGPFQAIFLDASRTPTRARNFGRQWAPILRVKL